MSTIHPNIAEIHGVDSSKVKNFPFSSFKLLGALQIGVGVICILLGVVDLFLFLYTSGHYENDTLKALSIACVPVWCGLWVNMFGKNYTFNHSYTSLAETFFYYITGVMVQC